LLNNKALLMVVGNCEAAINKLQFVNVALLLTQSGKHVIKENLL
jgi:transcriptional regulatory protein LevR